MLAPHYIAADAADRDALQAACEEIALRFGALHGVVVSTIVLQDQGLAHMDEARFAASLAAKVDVSVQLAAVFGRTAAGLRAVVLSVQSFGKAAGQSNYAAGCTFADAHAQGLACGRPSYPVKVVNWGYWGEVGVVATPEYRARMARAGIGSVRRMRRWRSMERLLAGPQQQVAFLQHDAGRGGAGARCVDERASYCGSGSAGTAGRTATWIECAWADRNSPSSSGPAFKTRHASMRLCWRVCCGGSLNVIGRRRRYSIPRHCSLRRVTSAGSSTACAFWRSTAI